jgi:hypothetical protein
MTNDMTPANAIIAPISLLPQLTPEATGALIILISALNPSPEECKSIDRALDNERFDPRRVAAIRSELYRSLRH